MKVSRLLNIALLMSLMVSIFMGTSVAVTSEDPLVRQALLGNLARSGLLVRLPYTATFATDPPLYHVGGANCWLLSLDLDQSTPGDQQSICVLKGSTITVTGKYQIFDRYNPHAIRQAFFVYSWTPSWPPPSSSYYYGLYDAVPGTYPGVTNTFSFTITIPNNHGVYYLYFCTQSHYSIPEAVAGLTAPLWIPYAVIVAAY